MGGKDDDRRRCPCCHDVHDDEDEDGPSRRDLLGWAGPVSSLAELETPVKAVEGLFCCLPLVPVDDREGLHILL